MAEQVSDERADELGIPRGSVRVESDEPHHYWACSNDSHNNDVDLERLIANMKSEGHDFVLWFVPKPWHSEYKLMNFAPQVLGAHTLSRWVREETFEEREGGIDTGTDIPVEVVWKNVPY